jgi:hypothetical protein
LISFVQQCINRVRKRALVQLVPPLVEKQWRAKAVRDVLQVVTY